MHDSAYVKNTELKAIDKTAIQVILPPSEASKGTLIV